jgi:hypothetical protein
MVRLFVISFIFFAGLNTAIAGEMPEQLPPDVSNFVEKRDLCDHFRQEDPYDEERRIFLEVNVEKFCTGTDAELAGLKKKYLYNDSIMHILNQYEEMIEVSNPNPTD